MERHPASGDPPTQQRFPRTALSRRLVTGTTSGSSQLAAPWPECLVSAMPLQRVTGPRCIYFL